MKILDKIISHKKEEVAYRKELYPIKLLEQSLYFDTKPVSLKKYLLREDKVGVIAEIKRCSPSKGALNPHINIEELSIGYMQAGAAALSILTDSKFFGGTNEELICARKFNFCPILRKDFTIDEYQILEAKSIGADAILLIARVLTTEAINNLTTFAKHLGLEVIIEIHNTAELEKLNEEIDIVGVNNRDLDTFEVNFDHALQLAPKISEKFIKIAESGINQADTIQSLYRAGYRGFLIGEAFMKASRPQKACQELVSEIRRQQSNA